MNIIRLYCLSIKLLLLSQCLYCAGSSQDVEGVDRI